MSLFPGLAGFDSGRAPAITERHPVPPTWERGRVDELYRSLAERREREESDRRIAQEAADAGFICCSCCGAWTRYAEDRCDQCSEPVDGGTDPLYELSVSALEARGSRSGEAA